MQISHTGLAILAEGSMTQKTIAWARSEDVTEHCCNRILLEGHLQRGLGQQTEQTTAGRVSNTYPLDINLYIKLLGHIRYVSSLVDAANFLSCCTKLHSPTTRPVALQPCVTGMSHSHF